MATLYLRGVPEVLIRKAKARAARSGKTLTTFLTEILARALGLELPTKSQLPEDLRPEMEWFEANKRKLVRQYEGKYMAVVGKEVVDHDRDLSVLAERVFQRYGVTPIFLLLLLSSFYKWEPRARHLLSFYPPLYIQGQISLCYRNP